MRKLIRILVDESSCDVLFTVDCTQLLRSDRYRVVYKKPI